MVRRLTRPLTRAQLPPIRLSRTPRTALLLMRCYRLLKQHFKSPGEPGDARCVLVGDSPQPLPHPAVPYQHSWPDVAGMAVPEHATKPPHSTMSQQLVVHMASVGAVPQKSMAVLAGCLAAFRSNNFSVTDDMVVSQAAGVYPLGALLNHSCAPNCIMTYDLRTQVQSVRTVCAVPAGTELTHPYLDPMTPRARRQRELQEEYGFSCSCRLCSVTHSSGSAQEASATSRPATAAGMWSLSTATLPPAEAAAWGSDVRSELKVGLDVASVLAVADELVAKAVELAEGEEDVPDRELALLRQATMLKASVLHPLNHALLPLHNRCKQAAMLAGDATAAAEHAAVALALYVHIYATSWPDLSQEAGGLDSADDVTSAAPSPSLPLHPLVALELSLLGELLQASAAAAGWWTGPLPTLHPEATWILQVLPSDLTSLQCAAKAIAKGVYGPQHAMAK